MLAVDTTLPPRKKRRSSRAAGFGLSSTRFADQCRARLIKLVGVFEYGRGEGVIGLWGRERGRKSVKMREDNIGSDKESAPVNVSSAFQPAPTV